MKTLYRRADEIERWLSWLSGNATEPDWVDHDVRRLHSSDGNESG
ncbi:hypothetical protein QT349_22435 [Escherichia coli]|nr:hypothetical protein [Escherichia coli]